MSTRRPSREGTLSSPQFWLTLVALTSRTSNSALRSRQWLILSSVRSHWIREPSPKSHEIKVFSINRGINIIQQLIQKNQRRPSAPPHTGEYKGEPSFAMVSFLHQHNTIRTMPSARSYKQTQTEFTELDSMEIRPSQKRNKSRTKS